MLRVFVAKSPTHKSFSVSRHFQWAKFSKFCAKTSIQYILGHFFIKINFYLSGLTWHSEYVILALQGNGLQGRRSPNEPEQPVGPTHKTTQNNNSIQSNNCSLHCCNQNILLCQLLWILLFSFFSSASLFANNPSMCAVRKLQMQMVIAV